MKWILDIFESVHINMRRERRVEHVICTVAKNKAVLEQ